MKNISVLAAFATFSVCAMISSVAVSAAFESDASATSSLSSVVIPVTQELPFDRYWSKS
jgi:hypothetical protein